jgi:putative glutamine amidotransferase
MPRPRIGLTTYHRDGDERPRFWLPAAYVDAVRLAGGLPLLIPPGDEAAEEILAHLDGVVFTGGGDIHPRRFGGEPHAHSYFMCDERDEFELRLIRQALARELPTLAICRGTQVLNVARGGDLHLHLPEVVGEAVAHRVSRELHTLHRVDVAPGSRLARVLGTASLDVASWHHQAVWRLGEGLRAVAWAEDATVEALELEGAPWLLAVQWHPELQLEAGSPQRRLFEALVGAAGGRAAA